MISISYELCRGKAQNGAVALRRESGGGGNCGIKSLGATNLCEWEGGKRCAVIGGNREETAFHIPASTPKRNLSRRKGDGLKRDLQGVKKKGTNRGPKLTSFPQ